MKMEIENVNMGLLVASPTNPRKRFPADKARELAGSVKESGVLEPLLVRVLEDSPGRFEIVAGERRWKAAMVVGLERVPCVVRVMTDVEVATAQLAENVVRCDLNPMEESAGVDRLAELGMDGAGIAGALGVSRRWVQERLALGELPARGRTAVERGALGLGAARVILRCEAAERDDVLQKVLGLGDDVTDAGVREFVAERYLEPRRRRKVWRERWAELETEWGDRAKPVEDPELWAQYVRPWGEGHGRWKAEDLKLGGVATRPEEAGVTWGELAKAHGLQGILVPVGGKVDGEELLVKLVVDGAAIQAAERAARDAGEGFTIGPRMKGREEPGTRNPEPGEEEAGAGAGEEGAGTMDDPAPVVDLGRGWCPELLRGWEWSADEVEKIRVAIDLLDGEVSGWRFLALTGQDPAADLNEADELLEELGGWQALVVWWCLRGPVDDKRLARLAAMFGVRELWMERGEES